MIQSFIDSWPLFQNTYITGWCLAGLLALVGVAIVARDQIFLGLAVSQASLLGVAFGMWLLATWPHLLTVVADGEWWLSLSGMAFAMLAALATSRARRPGRDSPEAITGWIYAFAGGLAVLVLSRSPHGLEEIHRLLSSTIIGATPSDVLVFAALLAATALAAVRWYEPITLLVMDAEMAGAVGISVRRWNICLALWGAIIIGLAMRVSGLLFTFGCLILPPLVAKNSVREVRSMFWVAPLVAVVTTFCAFIIANRYDFPPGQVAVALQGGLLTLKWVFRRG
ncbi:MAG: metal ABC transporter permease [Candidatus Binatia bacterium]|nr:metal ABC transporter permease [Candidatus Binatia bacterium]